MQTLGVDVAKARMSRSFLFVPADSERKMRKAVDTGADALIVDLEDSVTSDARPAARELAREFVAGKANVWVRINAMDTEDAVLDLQAVMPSAPVGIVLPKPNGAQDALRLARILDGLEEEQGIDAGSTRIMPICTEKPGALFALDQYTDSTPRLAALSWGAEDLSAAVGATESRDRDGNWLPPYELARSLCLFASAAASVAAVDTVYTDFRDGDGLANYAARARRDGFTGMLAIHPAQIDIINTAFMPSDQELSRAARIVALFDENPGTGAQSLDGQMVDRPHLIQAQRILQLAKQSTNK
jgi:citrate lyase subunit beta/citryl-CoA lyase